MTTFEGRRQRQRSTSEEVRIDEQTQKSHPITPNLDDCEDSGSDDDIKKMVRPSITEVADADEGDMLGSDPFLNKNIEKSTNISSLNSLTAKKMVVVPKKDKIPTG